MGHVAALPLRARIEGEELRGLFLLNAAVHPAHRGRSVSRIVAKAIREEATRLGFAFILGMGNKYSTGPLLRYYEMVRPLDARIGFGPLRRRPGGFRPSLERLWSREAMAWRLANPERPYSVRARGGRATVTAPTGRPGIAAILYEGEDRWGLVDRGDAPRGPLRVWLGLDPGVDWSRSRYVPIPKSLRRSPLNLVFRDLSGGGLHPEASRVVFRAIDLDPY